MDSKSKAFYVDTCANKQFLFVPEPLGRGPEYNNKMQANTYTYVHIIYIYMYKACAIRAYQHRGPVQGVRSIARRLEQFLSSPGNF